MNRISLLSIIFLLILSFYLALNIQNTQDISLKQPKFRYDPEDSRKAVYYALVTNCPIETIGNWSCGYFCTQNPGIIDVQAYYNNSHSGMGYVGYDPQNDLIVVAARGSKDLKNWFTDFQFWKKPVPQCEGCEVEAGFLHNYQDISELIINHTKFLKSKYPTASVFLTGHSLGAATVIVAAPFINQVAPVKIIQTFGSPRVGNQKFIQYFNELFKDIEVWRVVNYRDPVPHFPTKSMAYRQYNTEVWFNTPNISDIYAYDVCYLEEEPYCSDSVPLISINPEDHVFYLGVSMDGCPK